MLTMRLDGVCRACVQRDVEKLGRGTSGQGDMNRESRSTPDREEVRPDVIARGSARGFAGREAVTVGRLAAPRAG